MRYAITRKPLTLKERHALCQAKVTLNGYPACVVGARLPAAKVRAFGQPLEVEMSWVEVESRVRRHRGKFTL